MNIQEILDENTKLKIENEKLKKKLKRKKKRPTIKTKKIDIVNYWSKQIDECDLSVDWSEANERCWRCGYKTNLQKCHIIPDSLGGKDEPSNLVLLCARCHIDAPNVESEIFMWDWIKANHTAFYDTFWNLRAQKEYEFVYGKSYLSELKERDICSPYDLSLFWNLKIKRSTYHFAHPWNNESTEAGLLRMRLEEFDKTHNIVKKKSEKYRNKEKLFSKFIYNLCKLANQYNYNIWEGRSKNRFSITISSGFINNKHLNISIKLCKDNTYRACFTNEINPNNNTISEYTIELGNGENAINFIEKEIKKFNSKYGISNKQEYIFTIDPIYHLRDNKKMLQCNIF